MNLNDAQTGKRYTVLAAQTGDEEMDAFLFSLGCYGGEQITVVSRRAGSCVAAIKDGRYTLDRRLAAAIEIQ